MKITSFTVVMGFVHLSICKFICVDVFYNKFELDIYCIINK